MFLNRWAVDNFQWASNLVILLNLTAKLWTFYYNTALGLITPKLFEALYGTFVNNLKLMKHLRTPWDFSCTPEGTRGMRTPSREPRERNNYTNLFQVTTFVKTITWGKCWLTLNVSNTVQASNEKWRKGMKSWFGLFFREKSTKVIKHMTIADQRTASYFCFVFVCRFSFEEL